MFSSLTARLVMLVSVAILFVVGLTSYVHHREYSALLSDRIVEAIQQDLYAGGARFEQTAQEMRSYLNFLAMTPPLKALKEEKDYESHDTHVDLVFKSFMEARPNMFQVQFVPEQGMGLAPLFVSRIGQDITVAKRSNFSPYALKDYLSEVRGLKAGQVRTTPVRLLRDISGQPLDDAGLYMMFSEALIDAKGQRLGALSFTVSVDAVFQREKSIVALLESYLPGSRSYIVNGLGDYVLHPDITRMLAYERNERSNIVDDWAGVKTALEDEVDSFFLYSEDGKRVLMLERFNVGTDEVPNYFYMVLESPLESVFSDVYQLQLYIFLFTLLLLVFIVLLCGNYIHNRLKPLQNVVSRMRSYNPNEAFEPIEIGNLDEISEVSASFNSLAQQLTRLFSHESRIREGLNKFAVVSVMDLDGVVLEVNENFTKVTGYSDADIVGGRAASIRSGIMTDAYYTNIWQVLKTGEIWRDDMSYRAKDGSIIWMDTAIVPLENAKGQVNRFLNIQTDITDKRRLLNDIETERNKAEQASRVKSDFLASMSHELRTPLNSIIGFSQRLRRKLNGDISPRHMDAVETIERNGQHLLQVINEILDVAKIESGKMTLHPDEFDMVALVKEAIKTMTAQAKQKKLELLLDCPDEALTVFLDRKKIVQTLLNLLSNAIKYTPAGSVSVQLVQQDQWLMLEVKDTGIGIKDDDLSKLFVRFTQLESSISQRVEGTGLGLVLANEFVTMQGGRITVSSHFGEGSTFKVILPVRLSVERKAR